MHLGWMGVHKMRSKRMPERGSGQTSGRARNGPRLVKCRTCGDFEISTNLLGGQCPECSGQMPLALRGEGGRFISLRGGEQR